MKADMRVSEAAVAVRFGLWSGEEWYRAAEKAWPLSGPSCARPALEKSLSTSQLVFSTVFGMWGLWHLLLCSWPWGLWAKVRWKKFCSNVRLSRTVGECG